MLHTTTGLSSIAGRSGFAGAFRSFLAAGLAVGLAVGASASSPATVTVMTPQGAPPAPAASHAGTAGSPDGSPDVSVPRVYVVPMRGQMGTDIVKSIYDDVIKDIKEKNPDVVVYDLESYDIDQNEYLPNDDPNEAGVADLDEIRTLAETLKRELVGIRQVMWVHDAVGNSIFLVGAFPDMYMTSGARFGGGDGQVRGARRAAPDSQVAAKWTAAVVAYGAGLLQLGGYPKELAEALMMPERLLSISFEGRNLKWALDADGQWVLDGNPKFATWISSRVAADIGFADGIADDLPELMMLLGYREYEEVPESRKIAEQYVEEWRRQLELAAKWMLDYQDAMRYATGNDALRYLGQAKTSLEKVINSMRRYPAIETRWQRSRGVTRLALEREVDRIKAAIADLTRANRDTRRGGGGGGGGLGGSSGGGGGRRGR